MNDQSHEPPGGETQDTITVRLWAAARAAAGTGEVRWPAPVPVALSALVAGLGEQYGAGLVRVLGGCSVLVDEEPAGSRDPDAVRIRSGQTVDFLPPFAGG